MASASVEVEEPEELEETDWLDLWLRNERRVLLSCEYVRVAITSARSISRSTISMVFRLCFLLSCCMSEAQFWRKAWIAEQSKSGRAQVVE